MVLGRVTSSTLRPTLEQRSFLMANNFRHDHLRRLGRTWIEDPVYFITTNVRDRRPLLANKTALEVAHEVWETEEKLHGWRVGAYVLMPDHVHFFCAIAHPGARSLSSFVGGWKEWTAKYLHRRHGYPANLWQAEFFDRALRTEDSYSEKWRYVHQNPVRAGLVASPEAWPYLGSRHRL
jgi:putative transposase